MTYQLSKRIGFSSSRIKRAIEKLDDFLGAQGDCANASAGEPPTTSESRCSSCARSSLKRDLCGGALYRCAVSPQEADGIRGRDARRVRHDDIERFRHDVCVVGERAYEFNIFMQLNPHKLGFLFRRLLLQGARDTDASPFCAS